MREPLAVAPPQLPRPGRTMKLVLATIALVSVCGAVIHNWAPGPPVGPHWWALFACKPSDIPDLHLWTLLTSGVLTTPKSIGHVFFTLLGLYFFTPQLEKTWGGARLLRMLLVSVLVGNLLVLLVDRIPVASPIFHPPLMFGANAALSAVAVAWSREFQNNQVRLFFLLPISGRALFWFTIAMCVLGLVYYQEVPEGAMAPFGGVAVGLALGGHPSPARALWLRIKLALLRRKGATLSVESMLEDAPRPRAKRTASKGGPSLRVVQGGLEDELKNRKPPKDKRYLN